MAKRTYEEKQQDWKQRAYDKLLKGEDLKVNEVAKLIGKSTITMRWWESQGIITKTRKTPDDEIEKAVKYRKIYLERKEFENNG